MKYFQQFEDMLELDVNLFGYNGAKEKTVEIEYAQKVVDNIYACQVAMDQIKYLNIKEVVNLGTSINTKGNEYFPFLSNDQQTLFYTRQNNKISDENLWLAAFKNGVWQEGKSIGSSFNTITNEGMCTFTRDGIKMYFTACQRSKCFRHLRYTGSYRG